MQVLGGVLEMREGSSHLVARVLSQGNVLGETLFHSHEVARQKIDSTNNVIMVTTNGNPKRVNHNSTVTRVSSRWKPLDSHNVMTPR